MTATADAFQWRRVMITAFIPALLYAIGCGAILPVIPLMTSKLAEPLFNDGSTVIAVAGLVTSLLMIGELLGNLPGGWIISRIGERYAMISSGLVSLVGVFLCIVATTPWATGAGVFLIGLATAVFGLARHAFITTYVPHEYRARVLATVGGVFRFGYFVGPLMTVAVLSAFDALVAAYWIHVFFCVAAILVVAFARDPEKELSRSATVGAPSPSRRGLMQTVVHRRDVLLRLGAGAAIISALRAGRIVILPLWAVSIGLDDIATTTIIGIAGGIDFALFYLGGWLIDRYGRLWNALPSTLGLALGFIALAFTHDTSEATTWFITLTMIMSVANGLGTGILLTLGADLADPQDPAPFLGAWRFTGGVGNAAAPVAVSALTAMLSLPIAIGTLGVIGIVGAALFARYIPRYAPDAPRPPLGERSKNR